MKISKEEFVEAYNSFPPSAFVAFAFRYFSKETATKDKWLSYIATGMLGLLFLGGFLLTAMKGNNDIIKYLTLGFSGFLAILVSSLFAAALMNNWRIRKIRKKLGGISKAEYNSLVEKYFS
jgi:Na+-driven multidrug efflux pump